MQPLTPALENSNEKEQTPVVGKKDHKESAGKVQPFMQSNQKKAGAIDNVPNFPLKHITKYDTGLESSTSSRMHF